MKAIFLQFIDYGDFIYLFFTSLSLYTWLHHIKMWPSLFVLHFTQGNLKIIKCVLQIDFSNTKWIHISVLRPVWQLHVGTNSIPPHKDRGVVVLSGSGLVVWFPLQPECTCPQEPLSHSVDTDPSRERLLYYWEAPSAAIYINSSYLIIKMFDLMS